jgi:ClpP class serine protease
MPNWHDLLQEVSAQGSTHDILRRKYLGKLHRLTKRNAILYYSAWLQKGAMERQGIYFGIHDQDKNGLMTAIHRLDRNKGLDLILHTPGGDTAATESIVDYLRSMFGTDVRAIVPQLALSGGTMIALSCKSIVMGKQSSIGPVDPQFRGLPAHGVKEEIERAFTETTDDPMRVPIWREILSKYPPNMYSECEKAIKWAETLASDWLKSGMLAQDPAKDTTVAAILDGLGSHAVTLSHARHISATGAAKLGLVVEPLEDSPALQDAVLSLHHACMLTFSSTNAVKIIENHRGVAFIQAVGPTIVVAQQ